MVQKTIPQLNPTTSFDQNALVPIDSGIQSFKITAKNFALSLMKLFDLYSLKDNTFSMDFSTTLDNEMQISLHKPEGGFYDSGSALLANKGQGHADLIALNGTVRAANAAFGFLNRTEGTTMAARNYWYIGAGPNGTIIAATQEGALAGIIQKSTDGITWTAITAPVNPWATSIYAGVNGANDTYVIFGYDTSVGVTKILYSTNGGTTWTAGTVPAGLVGKQISNTAKCVFAEYFDGVGYVQAYLAIAAGSNQIFKSVNWGATWSNTTSPVANPKCILYTANAGGAGIFKLFGTNVSEGLEIWESANGTTWTQITLNLPAVFPLAINIYNVSFNGSCYVAAGENEYGLECSMFSYDLANWYSSYYPNSGWIRLLSTYCPLEASGISRGPSNLFYLGNQFSEDGRIWVKHNEETNSGQFSCVYAPVLRKIVGVNRNGASEAVKSFASMKL